MPKKRASGAARPFTYWATQSWKDKDGITHERRTQRWKIFLDIGEDANGKRIRKTFTGKTSAAAKQKYDEARSQLIQHGRTADRNSTLRKYVDLFLESSQQKASPGTWAHYRSALTTHLTQMELAAIISDIIPSDIQRIFDRMRRQQLSLATRRIMRTCLSQTFDLALADRVIDVNPVKSVKLKGMSEVDTGRRAFTEDELRRLLQATLTMPIQKATIWWWRIFTGMRQSEALGAELKNLHLEDDNPYYIITGQLAYIPRDHGCGEPFRGEYPCGMKKGGNCPDAVWRVPDNFVKRQLEGSICIKEPKSKRHRIVAITEELAEVMRRYLNATKDTPNPHGLIFRNKDGSPLDTKADTQAFKTLVAAAGMNPDERTSHELRYSAVSLMRKAGKDSKAIMEMIGHTSLKVDNIYTTLDEQMRADAASAIPAALGDLTQLLPKEKES